MQDEAKRDSDDELSRLLAAAKKAPDSFDGWDEIEALAEERPDDVAAAYRELISKELPKKLLLSLCERAVSFFKEWGIEEQAVVEALERALAVDPSASWAFQELTLLFTVARRFDDLLTIYDRALERMPKGPARTSMLQEAARVAGDLAGRVDRATDYLDELSRVRPDDPTVAQSLERLLRRDERWDELVALWGRRLDSLDAESAQATRVMMAECLLDQLARPEDALPIALRLLLSEEPRATEASGLLERIFASKEASADTTRRALEALRGYYTVAGRVDDVLRLLSAALARATGAERTALYKDMAELLSGEGRQEQAIEHYASLLVLEPASEERGRLRELATKLGRLERYAVALAAAAAACSERPTWISLLSEAADVREKEIHDADGAVDLLLQIFRADGVDSAALSEIAARLDALLSQRAASATWLDVIEKRAELSDAGEARRAFFGRAAALARDLGDTSRALLAWRRVLDGDSADQEALSTSVELLFQAERWTELIAMRHLWAESASSSDERRGHLAVAAEVLENKLDDVDGAIAAWEKIASELGSDDASIDALARLFEKSGRPSELAKILENGLEIASETGRRISLLGRLGDVLRTRLDDPAGALSRYVEALAQQAGCEAARAGLHALLDDGRARAGAVEALVADFDATGDAFGRLTVVEQRLTVTSEKGARAAILVDAAELEERRGDKAAALAALGRAFPLSPNDSSILEALLRLAKEAENHRVAAQAVAAAEAELPPGERSAELAVVRGRLLEGPLGDAEGALSAFALALALAPASKEAALAGVRTASRLGRWDVAASTLVRSSIAQGDLDEALTLAIQQAATQGGSVRDAATAVEAVLAEMDMERALVGKIERVVAVWYRDFEADLPMAERALGRALRREGKLRETLLMLADVQRRVPARALVETLQMLADTEDDPVESLREAAAVALELGTDATLTESVLARLLDDVSTRLVVEGDAAEPRRAEVAVFALDELVRIALEHGQYARALQLLVEAATWPLGARRRADTLGRAAAVAEERLGDTAKAVELLRGVLVDFPDDDVATGRLAAIFESEDRVGDLLALRRHGLERASTPSRRIGLRLDIATLLARTGDEAGAVAILFDNLAEEPAHGASLDRIEAAWGAQGRVAEVADLLEKEAEKLAPMDGERAGELWSRAAEIAEGALDDLPRALADLDHAVAVAPTPAMFDALARLHRHRGNHVQAVAWLEKRLEATGFGDENARIDTIAKLAEALSLAGRSVEARSCLEHALEEHTGAAPLREELRKLYRSSGTWDKLVELLVGRGDDASLVELREASEVCLRKLNDPSRAVPILESMIARAPEDRGARLSLATILRMQGDIDRSLDLLTDLVNEYGRRRPPERAEAHYQLARVLSALGDADGARAQLDLAVSINAGHAAALGLLGELCLASGDVERAERMYGTLMLLVMRTDGSADDVDPDAPSYAEVMLGMYRTLGKRGDSAGAAEKLTAAFDAAQQNDLEAARFETALRRAGEDSLLLRAIELRLSRDGLDENARAVLEAERAAVLERLGRDADAVDAWLVALALDPEAPEIGAGARQATRRAGATARYIDTLADIARKALLIGRNGLAAATTLAVAEAIDLDLADAPRALQAYREAQDLGVEGPAVWRPIARLSSEAGDVVGEIAALRRIVTAFDADEATLTEDLYRLAGLELEVEAELTAGLTTLEWALGRAADHGRAATLLRRAASRWSDDGIVELYEKVARSTGDPATLLDALGRVSEGNYAPMEKVREAVTLASQLGEMERMVALLRRAVELGSQDSTGLTPMTWALIALADRNEAQGDFAGAVDYLQKAADTSDTDDAVRLTTRIASIATEQLKSPVLGAAAYARLVERGLSDQHVWESLLALTRGVGDRDLLEKRLSAAIDAAFEPGFRNRLRMERAKLLFSDRAEEAAVELRLLVDEDDAEALDMLTSLYERQGDRAAQADLMERRLASAIDRGDPAVVETVALRLGELLETTRHDDAVDAYRRALEVCPDSALLLQKLLGLFPAPERAEERAAVMDRLLDLSKGVEAAALAVELGRLYEGLSDVDAMARALERGFAEMPTNTAIQERLLDYHRDAENWDRLAEMRMTQGSSSDGPAAVTALTEAAALFADKLDRPADAAKALELALAKGPADPTLVANRARYLLAAGQTGDARRLIDEALAAGSLGNGERVALLRQRASVSMAIDEVDAAARDLEAAFDLDPSGVAPDLIDCFELAWSRGQRSSDLLGRFVDVLLEVERSERARDLLDDWLDNNPSDLVALKRAIDLDIRTKDWDRAIDRARHLVSIEPAEGKPGAAVLLARACEEAGRPEQARAGLEEALRAVPGDEVVRERLRALYNVVGAHRDLAQLEILTASSATTDEARHAALREAARVYLELVSDAPAAIRVLEPILAENPKDHLATVYLADAFIAVDRLQDSANLLDAAIGAHKGRRSPRELAVLQHRMARIANTVGDPANALAWLSAAHESDVQNGAIAAELSEIATQLSQFDVALKALRAITLMKSPEPMSRATAYLRQAFIARHQGDARRALMLAKKAAAEDTDLAEATELIAELSAS